MKILAIETSCDETAAAVVADGRQILSNIIESSVEQHKKLVVLSWKVAARDCYVLRNLKEPGWISPSRFLNKAKANRGFQVWGKGNLDWLIGPGLPRLGPPGVWLILFL